MITSQHISNVPPTSPALLEHVALKALENRHLIIDALTAANSSHLGCSFSIIDILTVLYHCFLDVEKIKHNDPTRDYFILSKGHGACALYAALASVQLLPAELLKRYHGNGTQLSGHPQRGAFPGIEASTGSLGHGLPMAVGLAIAAKHDQRPSKVYALVGDGECQEGSIWEALMMAARFQLNNLTVIVDYNNLQGLDKTDDLVPGGLEVKFKAFGCSVKHVDGHDYAALIDTFNQPQLAACPQVIIAHTTKGKGLAQIENKLEWHYRSFKGDQHQLAKKEITRL